MAQPDHHDHAWGTEKEGMLAFYWRAIVRTNARSAVLLALLMLTSALFQMGAIGLAAPLLEATNGNNNSWVLDSFRSVLSQVGLTPNGPLLVFAVLGFAGILFVTHSGLTFLHQYSASIVAEKLRRKTKARLFETFLSGQYEAIVRRGRGAIVQDLSAPPMAVYTAIIRLSTLFSSIFTSLVLIAFMLYLSFSATVLVATFGLVGIYGTRRVVDARSRNAGRILYELQSDESRLAVDAIDGLKVVKAHGLEHLLGRRLSSLLDGEYRPSLQVARYRYLPNFLNEAAAISIVLILGAISLLRPASGITFPTLAAFLLAIRQCGNSVASINALVAELQSVRRSVEVVPDVLQQFPPEPSGSQSMSRVSEIRLDNVSLEYESRGEVLHKVNLTMKRGTITAVVGPTGAGKSSIANLIVGLYRPSSGNITVDDVDLRDLDISQWRKRIGYVSQDTFLFNASIRDNIALWNDAFSRSEIENAASLAQLADFVADLPHGYDTIVGDRGLRLSGGQCQRIAIARAILMNPAVLVLDEATSALDNLTEKAVYEAMRALRAKAVVLAVAHRLSTIKDADQIVVLEGGHVVEIGTHGALVNEGGSYSRLYTTEAAHN
jgi:ABC-type multidrug transport system fused ATPase/permease subunit